MQCPFAPNMIKCRISLVGIDTFMGFVDDEDIPCDSLIGAELREFVKLSVNAEIDRSLQILQTHKFDTALCMLIDFLQIFLAAVDILSVLDSVHITDK